MAREGEGIMRCVAADHRSSADMDMLSNFKTALGRHLGVRAALDVKRCIACTRAHTWSLAGTFQHRKTGLCETCWCVLAKSPSEEKNNEVLTVCDRLQDGDGCEFMYHGWPWQTASGSSNCLSMRNSKLTTSRVLFLEQLRCQTSGDRDIVQILKKIHCLHRIRASQNVVSQRCACRCGPRIAFVTSWCRTKKLPCSTHAAAGCVLLSSHTPPPWPQVQVLGSVGADGVSSANPPTPNAEWRRPMLHCSHTTTKTGFSSSRMQGILLLEKPAVPLDPTMPGGWVQLPIHVESVLHFQHELGMEFQHRGRCRMGHKTLMARAKLSPLTEHIHVSRASSDGPSWSHHWKHEKAWMCFVAPLPGLSGISIT